MKKKYIEPNLCIEELYVDNILLTSSFENHEIKDGYSDTEIENLSKSRNIMDTMFDGCSDSEFEE